MDKHAAKKLLQHLLVANRLCLNCNYKQYKFSKRGKRDITFELRLLPIKFRFLSEVCTKNFLLLVILQSYISTIEPQMAALIDSALLFSQYLKADRPFAQTESDSHQKILKTIKITQETITLPSTAHSIQTATYLRLNHCELLVRITLRTDKRIISTRACLLDGRKLWKSPSRQAGLLLMRAVMGRQTEFHMEGSIFISRGGAFMNLEGFHLPPEGTPFKISHQYHRLLARNLLTFEKILQQTQKVGRKQKVLPDGWSEQKQWLQLADILRTTQTNIGISEAKSQFMFAKRSFVEQSQQLAIIEKSIVQAGTIEGVTLQLYLDLYAEALPTKIRAQLVPSFQKHIRKLTSLLMLRQLDAKTIEDYNYNIVRVVEYNKEAATHTRIGDGASSIVFSCPMKLVFANSIEGDHSPLIQEAVQMAVAVKRQRKGYQSKRNKIAHQQQIVAKFKNSTSPFLPKYFGTPAEPELVSSIIMEKIQGEELDQYVSRRSESISLNSKLSLLLNISQGLRQLHICGVVHLDLKPFNVMVGPALVPKLIDFGDAYHREVCGKTFMPGLTFPWVAPEVILRLRRLTHRQEDTLQFSQKQDVFSFAFLIAEVVFGTRVLDLNIPRYQHVYSRKEVLSRVFYAPERATAYGDDLVLSMLVMMMIRCMDMDPEARPRMEWIGIALRLMLSSLP